MTSTDEEAGRLSLEIGQRTRALRKKAGLSGRKLAAAAGVSQPFLSQLEHGQTSASIATLYRIANALNTTPADLLPKSPDLEVEIVRAPRLRTPVSEDLRAATAQAIFRGGKTVTELYDFVVEPGEYVEEWFESRTDDIEHVVYVLEGQIRVEFDDRADVLIGQGDALFYPGKLRHRWHLESEVAARAILVAINP